MSKIVNVAIVGCGGMGGGHAVAIATGSGQALWMTDGSKGRELAPPGQERPAHRQSRRRPKAKAAYVR